MPGLRGEAARAPARWSRLAPCRSPTAWRSSRRPARSRRSAAPPWNCCSATTWATASRSAPRVARRIRTSRPCCGRSSAGRFAEAIAIAKQHLALPATLGRVCHRPCERPCRRKTFDAPVAIGLIERCVADQDLASRGPLPARARRRPRVGAWRSSAAGRRACRPPGTCCCGATTARCSTSARRPAAACSTSFPPTCCRREVVAAEVELIRRLGAGFELGGPRVDAARLEQLLADFDAVLCAVGRVRSPEAAQLGLAAGLHGIGVNRFLQTSRPRVFAAGQAARRTGRRVHSVAGGRTGGDLPRPIPLRGPVGPPGPAVLQSGQVPEAGRDAAVHGRRRSDAACSSPGEGQGVRAFVRGRRGESVSPHPSLSRREQGDEGLDPRGSHARGRPMLPLRLPQGRQLPLARGRRGTRGPPQPLRRAAARGRSPHRSFLGHLRARQVHSLRKLPPRGGEGRRAVGAGLRGSRIRRPRYRPAERCLVGGPATGRAGVRGSLPHRRPGAQAGKRAGRDASASRSTAS